MPNVPITAVSESDPTAARIQEELKDARAAISERAFWLSTQNAGRTETEYWLWAERELFNVPACELMEQNGDLRLRAAVPGLETQDLRLTAMPDGVVIQSARRGEGELNGHQVVFSEINRNPLLRHVVFPERIDPVSVKAKLERGVLEITAAKAGATPRKSARRGVPKTAKLAPAAPAKKSSVKTGAGKGSSSSAARKIRLS